MRHRMCSFLIAVFVPMAVLAQAPPPKKQAAKSSPSAARPAPKSVPAATAPHPNSEPEVLTNASVIKLLAAGLDDEIVIAKINSSPAAFSLDTDGLVALKAAKVPPAVVRADAELESAGKRAGGCGSGACRRSARKPRKRSGPGDPVRAARSARTPALPPSTVIARQGINTFPLSDKPQTIMFVKSEAGTAKEAVVNIVLGDVGIQLLTMGLQPMMGWNPYLGDTLNKMAKVGKGLLLNKSGDTKGFEIETLTGSTADVTLKEGKAEFLIPVNRYIPSADMDPSTLEPVVLHMQPRDNEQRRVLSGRKVIIKSTKKGRFDLKPTTEREESNVEQSLVPVTVERMAENMIRITTNEELKRGEYALVFRKKDAANLYTTNVPLKPTPPAHPAETAPAAPTIPGMTPEMMGQLTPEQIQMMQQMQLGQQAPPARGGMFGMGKKRRRRRRQQRRTRRSRVF